MSNTKAPARLIFGRVKIHTTRPYVERILAILKDLNYVATCPKPRPGSINRYITIKNCTLHPDSAGDGDKNNITRALQKGREIQACIEFICSGLRSCSFAVDEALVEANKKIKSEQQRLIRQTKLDELYPLIDQINQSTDLGELKSWLNNRIRHIELTV